MDLKERLRPRHARSMSGSPESRRGHAGDKKKSVSAHSRGSRHRSHHKDTKSCYQSSRSRETEFAFEKHHNKRASSRRTEALSESEGVTVAYHGDCIAGTSTVMPSTIVTPPAQPKFIDFLGVGDQ
ncbi:hypothetical protein Tco_1190296 [Tanacetum coccineum]